MNFLTFFIYIFATIYSPGPNIIMGMSLASNFGIKKVWRFTLGVFIALLISFGLCAAFSKFLYDFIPAVEPYMYAFGGIYLLWLAYGVYKSGFSKNPEALAGKNRIKMGMLNQFMNIKNQIFGLTVFSSYILPNYNSIPVIVFSVVGLSLFAMLAIYIWMYVGTTLMKHLQKHKRIINTVLALSLVYCAVSMFCELI